ERDTFMRELSAAGAVETSPSVFYDIAHDVEVWRLQPEWFQAREALRDCKAWVEEQRAGFQRLHEALQAVERPNAWVSSEADLERFRVMSDLQGYIGNAAMEHALGTLAALDQRLEGYLQGWDSRYPVEPGRPPNKATQDLLHRLSETYERAGGRLTTTWTAGKNCPQSPFAKFLV
ncbi:MAG TPA: hypothetical protein VG758_24865, partial [Hyphomicrobiaceae bacterium]|nr:hypothetical protein [Hyphomicrobiaceae bacterium]